MITDPTAAPAPPLRYHDSLIPRLPVGDYTLKAGQRIVYSDGGTQQVSEADHGFEVRAPRFVLDPAFVHGAYPAPNSTGRYANLLPHVTLTRETLPWEVPVTPKGSWLAVLLFARGELTGDPGAEGRTEAIRLADLLTPVPGEVRPLPAVAPSADEKSSTCHTVLVPAALFAKVAPRTADLPYIAHLRQGGSTDDTARGAASDGRRYAVVAGTRFPDRPSRYVAHLVSLEGLGSVLDTAPTKPVRLLSLWSWSFDTHLTTSRQGFGTLAAALAAASVKDNALRVPVAAPPSAGASAKHTAQRLRQGFVPLPFRAHSGEHTFAWYRGPLSPVRPRPLPTPPELLGRPRSASQLLIYLEEFGIFDVSYAAAFSLGRALAVADTDFGSGYTRGVRSQRRLKASGKRFAPTVTPPKAPEHEPDARSAHARWLSRLRLLDHVPFAYLVPDARMLPSERLRLCHVDPDWINALEAGAASVATGDPEDEWAADQLWALRAHPTPAAALLLRSALVTAWPGMAIRCVDEAGPVAVARRATLASGVELMLLGRPPTNVTLEEPHRSAHLGITPEKKITLREITGRIGASRKSVPVSGALRSAEPMVLDLGARLHELLKTEFGTGIGPSAMALQLVASTEYQVLTVAGDA